MKRFMILISVAIVTDCIHAQEFTEGNTNIYRHGNSSATITQDGVWSEFWVERDFDSQTIIQRRGGNNAVIRQSRGKHTAPPETRKCIKLHVSEEFRRLFLDRFNQRYCE